MQCHREFISSIWFFPLPHPKAICTVDPAAFSSYTDVIYVIACISTKHSIVSQHLHLMTTYQVSFNYAEANIHKQFLYIELSIIFSCYGRHVGLTIRSAKCLCFMPTNITLKPHQQQFLIIQGHFDSYCASYACMVSGMYVHVYVAMVV